MENEMEATIYIVLYRDSKLMKTRRQFSAPICSLALPIPALRPFRHRIQVSDA